MVSIHLFSNFIFFKKVSKKYHFTKNMNILNAGSGGNTYNVPGKHYHVDIA